LIHLVANLAWHSRRFLRPDGQNRESHQRQNRGERTAMSKLEWQSHCQLNRPFPAGAPLAQLLLVLLLPPVLPPNRRAC
jgi:hypothetical protein